MIQGVPAAVSARPPAILSCKGLQSFLSHIANISKIANISYIANSSRVGLASKQRFLKLECFDSTTWNQYYSIVLSIVS